MGPLAAVRVVEFAGLGPAPFAAMLLADLGADVVRIDRRDGPESSLGVSPAFDLSNRNKRSVGLDLKAPEDAEVARRLVGRAHVLVEGFRPGVMERLGLGPDDCLASNPGLVYGRMTGWGQDGPLASRAGHDVNYIALSGALHAIGPADGAPSVPVNVVGDFGGGALYLTVGILAALWHARATGEGQVVDAAIVDGAASLLVPIYGLLAAGLWQDVRGRNLLDGGCPWYGVFETRDGRHVSVGPIEPQFYRELVDRAGLGQDDLAAQWDITAWPALRERLAAVFRGRTRDEWEAVFAGADACVAPVLSLGEAPGHPHATARQTYVTVEGVVQPGVAPRLSRTPGAIRHGPPRPGSDTAAVLADWGLDDGGAAAGAGCR